MTQCPARVAASLYRYSLHLLASFLEDDGTVEEGVEGTVAGTLPARAASPFCRAALMDSVGPVPRPWLLP